MKKNFLSLLANILLLTFGTSLLSLFGCQEATIDFKPLGSLTGQVFQKDTGEPLEGVEMTTIPASSVVYTDSTGTFIFVEIEANEYRLRASLEDYQSESVSVTVSGRGESTATLFMTVDRGVLEGASEPIPNDQATNVSTAIQLNWKNTNESSIDVKFDIEIFEADSEEIFKQYLDITDTFVLVQNLKFNTQYFWQVSTKSSQEAEYSKLWRFKTLGVPDHRILLNMKNENGYYEVYSIQENGEELTRLTYSNQNKLNPLFSPDRASIAFLSADGFDQHIYVMNSEGRGIKKITNQPVGSYHSQGRSFSWSPDGSKIVYCHYDKLYQINADGTDLQQIASAPANRHFRSVDWGEATNQLLVQTVGVGIYDGEIYVMNADGSGMTELVSNLPGILEHPAFSIDGLRFIYTLDVSGNETLNGRQLDSHIFIAQLANPANVTDLSVSKTNGTNDSSPRVSSDGAKVIFVNRANDGSGSSQIMTLEIDDASNRFLVQSGAFFPSWR
jgi:TolB protein